MYRFDRDLRWRTGVEIVPIQCWSSNNFCITKSGLEEAYSRAQHLKVKGIFVTNPSNPLGTFLSDKELDLLITFAIQHNTHIVSDEIYSGTVFAPPRFTTIIEALHKRLPDPCHPMWGRVHVVSSLSKDLGLPGFRIGAIYSFNQTLIAAATKMSSFGLVSSQSQFLLSKILADKPFIRKYIKENKKRLRRRQRMLVSGLKKSGIRCLRSNAGLFCWVDMRFLMSSHTFEAEEELWKRMLFDFGINVSPGSSCHCAEPGWFRICFANMPQDTLRLALHRIRALVHSTIPIPLSI